MLLPLLSTQITSSPFLISPDSVSRTSWPVSLILATVPTLFWPLRTCVKISEKIKPPEVIVKGEFTLTTYEPDGIDSIKKLLNAVTDPNAKLSYISAPKYRIEVKSTNYKTAESILKQITDSILNSAKKLKIIAEFSKVG